MNKKIKTGRFDLSKIKMYSKDQEVVLSRSLIKNQDGTAGQGDCRLEEIQELPEIDSWWTRAFGDGKKKAVVTEVINIDTNLPDFVPVSIVLFEADEGGEYKKVIRTINEFHEKYTQITQKEGNQW